MEGAARVRDGLAAQGLRTATRGRGFQKPPHCVRGLFELPQNWRLKTAARPPYAQSAALTSVTIQGSI